MLGYIVSLLLALIISNVITLLLYDNLSNKLYYLENRIDRQRIRVDKVEKETKNKINKEIKVILQERK